MSTQTRTDIALGSLPRYPRRRVVAAILDDDTPAHTPLACKSPNFANAAAFPAIEVPATTAFKGYTKKKKVDSASDVLLVGETDKVEYISNEGENKRAAETGCRYAQLYIPFLFLFCYQRRFQLTVSALVFIRQLRCCTPQSQNIHAHALPLNFYPATVYANGESLESFSTHTRTHTRSDAMERSEECTGRDLWHEESQGGDQSPRKEQN